MHAGLADVLDPTFDRIGSPPPKIDILAQVGTGERRVEVSNSELATTFYFLIIVGYYLRQLEVSPLKIAVPGSLHGLVDAVSSGGSFLQAHDCFTFPLPFLKACSRKSPGGGGVTAAGMGGQLEHHPL